MTNPRILTGSVTVPARIAVQGYLPANFGVTSTMCSERFIATLFINTLRVPGVSPHFDKQIWQEMAWGHGDTEEQALEALRASWAKVQGTLTSELKRVV